MSDFYSPMNQAMREKSLDSAKQAPKTALDIFEIINFILFPPRKPDAVAPAKPTTDTPSINTHGVEHKDENESKLNLPKLELD